MIKCFFTVLFLSSLTILLSCGGKKDAPKTKEAIRFEKLLQEAGLQSKDSVRYLIWNSTSCGGCRVTCVRLLQNDHRRNIKLIVPFRFAEYINGLDAAEIFVDTAGRFDKIYFGIDNIGIVKVYDGNVTSIKNYNPEAMDSLAIDWVK